MNETQLLNFFKSYKKGSYTSIIKETNKNGYIKRVSMVCRFVNYYNIKTIKEKDTQPKPPREFERVLIPHILKLNTNTNNLLLCVYKTNNEKQRAKIKYYYHDDEINESQYYEGIKEKKRDNNDTVIFNFKAADVVALGGSR